MKKLLTMLSAAATAIGLQAGAPYPSGTSFNDENWPSDTEKALWTSTEGLSISQESLSYTGDRPEQFKETEDKANLKIERKLDDPTFRAIAVGADGNAVKQTIGEGGLLVDTMIKFTAFDQEDTASIDGTDAKVAVWVKEIEGEEGEASTYQLMVTAGCWDKGKEELVRKDYACVSRITDMDAWYCLTVKTFSDVSTGLQIPGFVVCVNGEVVTSGDAKADIDASGLTLSTEGAQWNAMAAVFPAIVRQDMTIKQVGFAGTGFVDDLSITDKIPGFVATKDSFSVIGGEHVVSFKYGDLVWKDGQGALVITDPSSPDTVTDIVYEDGFFGDVTWKVSKEKDVVTTVGNAKAEAASVTIGDTKTPYATMTEALTAVNTATSAVTLKLGADTTPGLTIKNVNEGVSIIIDLAGKKVTQGADDTAAIYVEAGTVVIDDTIGGGIVQGFEDDGVALVAPEGEATLKKGIYNGLVGGTLTITSADVKILASANLDGIAATLPEGMKWGKDETSEYWMLVEKGEGVTFAVTAAAHTTATVEIDGEVVESIPESLTVGQTYKVTFTAADGYAFAEDARTVFDGTVADADVSIEGPAVTAVTYSITYAWTGLDKADVAKVQNSNPLIYTIESATITFVAPTCEGYTFKGFDPTEIAAGSMGNVTVTGSFEKGGSTKPTTWDEVTDDTPVADLPGVTAEQATALDAAGVTASAVATWAKGSGAVTAGEAINLDAFVMEAANTANTADLEAKAAKEFTQEILDAIVKDGLEADLSKIADKYPNAKVELIPATEIDSTDTAKFFKLKFTLKTK